MYNECVTGMVYSIFRLGYDIGLSCHVMRSAWCLHRATVVKYPVEGSVCRVVPGILDIT